VVFGLVGIWCARLESIPIRPKSPDVFIRINIGPDLFPYAIHLEHRIVFFIHRSILQLLSLSVALEACYGSKKLIRPSLIWKFIGVHPWPIKISWPLINADKRG
jgi:hypothetical protein